MVFYADTGNERRRQAKITGGCVNLAARLMVAAREGVLCDEATRRATASSFLFEPVEAVPAKGFADPVVAWRPVRRVAEQRRVFDGKLIGREVEFAQLRGAIDALLAGAGTGLMLRGEAGIGKSRLAADVAGYASACGVRVVWAVGSLLESGTPYYPWRAALRTLLCPLGDFSPDGALFEARRLLADADTLSGWLPLLGDIEPVVHRESLLVNEMTGQARAASLRTLMVELLRRFAVQRPLMVVVEDVHWFDHQSRTLYSHIAQNADPGLLVLGTTRPGDDLYPGTRTGYAGGTRMLEIGPLDREGLAALARDRLGAARVADGLVDFVESASGGNPFYAEQVLLSLRSTGRLARVADGVDGVLDPWMDGGPASGDTAWREMLTSRVDALSSPEKVAIRLAAVIGRSFSEEMLVDLATSISEGTDVVEVIDELVAEDIFRESPAGDGTLDFRHTLLREAMYSQTAYATRKSLHALIAHWIEEHEADRIELRHSELAMHCERAHDLSRAVHHLEQAAAISSLRCASREAISQARRAMELAEEHMLPPDSGRTTRCEAILGDAHNELFQYEAAKHHFKRALASAGRPAPRTTASLLLGIIAQLVVQAGRRLRLWSSEHADPAQSWASRVYQKLGEIAYFDGSNLAVLHATLTSLNLAERSGAVREAVGGLAALAIGFQSVGLRRVSRLYNGRSIDLAERKGGVADVAYAHLVNGVYQAANTDWQAASESLQKAAQHYVTLGAGERWQQAYAGLCAVAVTRGRFEEAHELLRLMQAHQSEMPVQITAYAHAFATCVALAQGGPLEALVAKLREIIRANDLAKIDRMFCQGLIASACWRVGDGPAAIAAARAGLSILETGVPAAWYVTEGLAGIAGTLLEASESGQALAAEGGRALKGLLRYARNNPVASGRAALLGGWDLMQKGHTDRSVARWRQGLEHAQQRGTRYDAALLLSALSSCGALEASEADSLRQCGKELLEELGAVAWIPLCHRTHRS
jgi:adenylate cyclase